MTVLLQSPLLPISVKAWRPPCPDRSFSKFSEMSLLGRRLCGTLLVGLRLLVVVVMIAAVVVVVVVVIVVGCGGAGLVGPLLPRNG